MTRSWPRVPTSPTVRPLRRAIQKLIEDPLSEELLAGESGARGDTVLCDVADGKFVFSHGAGEIPAPRPAGALGGDTAPAAPHRKRRACEQWRELGVPAA